MKLFHYYYKILLMASLWKCDKAAITINDVGINN